MNSKNYKKKQDEHMALKENCSVLQRNKLSGPLKAIMIPKSTSLKKYTKRIVIITSANLHEIKLKSFSSKQLNNP